MGHAISTTHQQHADTAKASSADAVASLQELGLRPVLLSVSVDCALRLRRFRFQRSPADGAAPPSAVAARHEVMA